jgi:DNA-binding transcriptional LysR family regulator
MADMNNITFQQIQAFLATAKHQSLSKAAGEMFISQPALSKMLQRLEAELGITLFRRSNKGVELTDAGRTLCLTFESFRDNLDRAVNWAKSSISVQKYLHIALPDNYDLPDEFTLLKGLVAAYEKKYPDVIVLESLFALPSLCQSLDFGGINLMFAPSFAVSNLPAKTRRRFSKFEVCLAVAAASPIHDFSDPSAFENTAIYAMQSSDAVSDLEFITRLCHDIGFTPGAIAFPPNSVTILHAIRRGRGIGMCWKPSDIPADSDIRFLPIDHDISQLYIDAVWNPENLTPEAQCFIDMLP